MQTSLWVLESLVQKNVFYKFHRQVSFSEIKWNFMDTYLSRIHFSVGPIGLKFILKKDNYFTATIQQTSCV